MNELIYKQDAINAIMSEPPDAHYPSWYANILKELPAVDTDLSAFSDNLWKIAYERGKAEGRKKGKWIEHHEPYTWMGYTYWTCSKCNFGEKEENKERSNFCPHCGADMREGEEE